MSISKEWINKQGGSIQGNSRYPEMKISVTCINLAEAEKHDAVFF
jgi:hypothetical protein